MPTTIGRYTAVGTHKVSHVWEETRNLFLLIASRKNLYLCIVWRVYRFPKNGGASSGAISIKFCAVFTVGYTIIIFIFSNLQANKKSLTYLPTYMMYPLK